MGEEIVTGCIQHKDRRHLRLYCDYMQLYKLNEHKAKIVRVLETWTDSKRNEWYKAALDGKEQGQVPPEPDFWITMSFQQFRYFLYETASVDTIKKNVSELVEKDKHIQRRVNPDNPYGPPQYLLNYKALQKSLNKLPSPSFLPDIPSMEDTPPGEKTPPPENQPLPQGSKIPLPRGENYPHPRGENTPPSNNRDNNTSNNNEIDYVSAHAERTPASEFDQEQQETLKALQAGLIESGVIDESPIATPDTQPTLLQAEQERENHATFTRPTNILEANSPATHLATAHTDHRANDVHHQPVLSTPSEKPAHQAISQGARHSDTQIGDSHNGHGGLRNHGTSDTGDRATLLPLVPMDGGGSTTGTQAAQEVIPIGVDKSLMNGDKSGKGKKPPKPKEEKLPPSKPVEPLPDMAWGTRKCLQWFDFWRGGQLISTYKLMQASKCAAGLATQFDEQTVIQVRHTMNADPYYETRGGCDVCDVANNIHKYLNKMQKNTIKATMGAIASGPSPRPTALVSVEQAKKNKDAMFARAEAARQALEAKKAAGGR